uniref:Uncharacterized protein n=1 Tax=viral metagenome TaxID=1070528 RepID=A0A6C0DBC2_9ZZZZ
MSNSSSTHNIPQVGASSQPIEPKSWVKMATKPKSKDQKVSSIITEQKPKADEQKSEAVVQPSKTETSTNQHAVAKKSVTIAEPQPVDQNISDLFRNARSTAREEAKAEYDRQIKNGSHDEIAKVASDKTEEIVFLRIFTEWQRSNQKDNHLSTDDVPTCALFGGIGVLKNGTESLNESFGGFPSMPGLFSKSTLSPPPGLTDNTFESVVSRPAKKAAAKATRMVSGFTTPPRPDASAETPYAPTKKVYKELTRAEQETKNGEIKTNVDKLVADIVTKMDPVKMKTDLQEHGVSFKSEMVIDFTGNANKLGITTFGTPIYASKVVDPTKDKTTGSINERFRIFKATFENELNKDLDPTGIKFRLTVERVDPPENFTEKFPQFFKFTLTGRQYQARPTFRINTLADYKRSPIESMDTIDPIPAAAP